MSLLTLKTPLRIVPAMPQRPPQANIPQTLAEREQLRDIVRRHVDARRATLVPPLVVDELRVQADAVIAQAGVDPVYSDYVGVLVNNEVWSEHLASVPFERRLLLLPKCMRVEDKCPAPFDEFGLLCKQCGLCTIRISRGGGALGYAVLVAEGSALVMALIQSGKIDAIVGVSCLSVLNARSPIWRQPPYLAWRFRSCRTTARTPPSTSIGSGMSSTSRATIARAGSISTRFEPRWRRG
jgi:hypothetical protein